MRGEVIRTVGSFRVVHPFDLLPQNVNRIRKDHQRNEDRRFSFFERVDAGIGVWHFGSRLGNQLFNLCPRTHEDRVGPKTEKAHLRDRRKPWPSSGEVPEKRGSKMDTHHRMNGQKALNASG